MKISERPILDKYLFRLKRFDDKYEIQCFSEFDLLKGNVIPSAKWEIDEEGCYVLTLLDGEKDIEEITKKFSKKFNIPLNQALKKVISLMQDLLYEKIVDVKYSIKFNSKRAKIYNIEGFGLGWLKYPFEQGALKKEFDLVSNILNSFNKVVLDVGTGGGRYAAMWVKKKSRSVIAIDISTDMLKATKKEGVALIRCDAERLPLIRNSIDIVCCIQTFLYLDPMRSMKEFARVLRRGGKLVISINVVEKIGAKKTVAFNVTRYDSLEDTRKYFEKARIKLISLIDVANSPYVVAFGEKR